MNPLDDIYSLEMLRKLAITEAQRSNDAIAMLLKKKAQAASVDPDLDIMTTASAQQNAAIYHVGAAICARLDNLIAMFEASDPEKN